MTRQQRDIGLVADGMAAAAIAGDGEGVLCAQPLPAAKGDLVVVKILAATSAAS